MATNKYVIPILALFLILGSAAASAANSLQRDEDPVVVTGAQVSALLGKVPGAIVAFRFDGAWTQIPVQVDERDFRDFAVPYNTLAVGVGTLMYADGGTFTGPDTDPMIDADDELVFMARDAGDLQRSPATLDPAGVLPGSRVELAVTNPIDLAVAYVYLFVTDGTLLPGAEQDYVTYNFNLLSGDYKATYGLLSGPNPENSDVTTAYYRTHFSDRWIRDEVNVKAGSATQADVIDRHKNLFAPGNCARSENTFSNGEGCFIANIDGPVRAIRSYLGANSGPFAQRVHLFYERRHDIATHLRVHAIPGVTDFYDYSPEADNMTYYNDLNAGGASIDGDPTGDMVTPGAIVWEMVTGAQGTLIMALALDTDIPSFAYTSYYSDDATPAVTQCTGDNEEHGASGPWVNAPIPNTDPLIGSANTLVVRRTVYYEEPDQSVDLPPTRYLQATNLLSVDIATGVAANAPTGNTVLMQNTPNPFSGSTAIDFIVPEAGMLRIYDVAGRLVRTLIAGVSGRAIWDGLDAHGRRAPSGVYFYRLEAGGSAGTTRKMVHIR